MNAGAKVEIIVQQVPEGRSFVAICRCGPFQRDIVVSPGATRERCEQEIGRAVLLLLEQPGEYWPEAGQRR